MYCLFILLMDGLAENILLELLPCLKDGRFGIFKREDERRLRHGIFLMMTACRWSNASDVLDENIKICDALSKCAVGTECHKNFIRAPDPNLLGSITSLNEHMLKSVEQMALERTGKRERKNKPKQEKINKFEPDYLKLSILLEIIGIKFDNDEEMPIGTKLINYRAEEVKKKTTIKEMVTLYEDLKKGWKSLLDSGNDRGRATKRIKFESEENTTTVSSGTPPLRDSSIHDHDNDGSHMSPLKRRRLTEDWLTSLHATAKISEVAKERHVVANSKDLTPPTKEMESVDTDIDKVTEVSNVDSVSNGVKASSDDKHIVSLLEGYESDGGLGAS